MTSWIYESSDGGKTVTRRLPHEADDTDYKLSRQIAIDYNIWIDKVVLRDIVKNLYKEEELREKFPNLKDLYEEYQTLLRLVSDGETK